MKNKIECFIDFCEYHYKKIIYPLMLSPLLAAIISAVVGAIEAKNWDCY